MHKNILRNILRSDNVSPTNWGFHRQSVAERWIEARGLASPAGAGPLFMRRVI